MTVLFYYIDDWFRIYKFCPEKKNNFTFFKMRKYKQKNPRNTIYKEKWQLEEQLLTAKKGREASESLV